MDTPTLYTVSPGLTFVPTGKHPTGTLTGDFYLNGKRLTHGAYQPDTNEVHLPCSE